MEWKPIETAPKDGTDILLSTKNGMTESYFALGEWRQSIYTATYEGEIYFIDEPTHWMPLPEAPNVKLRGCGNENEK